MLCSIFVAIIFNSVFPTNCFVQPWHHLIRVKKIASGEANVLPPSPEYRYEVEVGSQGMFTDVAQEIQKRMKGIVDGPFILMFDFGGIAAKYFSIIEDFHSGPGIGVASASGATASGATTEIVGIEKHGISVAGEKAVPSVVVARPKLAMTSAVGEIVSTVQNPVQILAEPQQNQNSEVLTEAPSAGTAVNTLMLETNTSSGLEVDTFASSPPSVFIDVVGNIPSSSNAVEVVEGQHLGNAPPSYKGDVFIGGQHLENIPESSNVRVFIESQRLENSLPSSDSGVVIEGYHSGNRPRSSNGGVFIESQHLENIPPSSNAGSFIDSQHLGNSRQSSNSGVFIERLHYGNSPPPSSAGVVIEGQYLGNSPPSSNADAFIEGQRDLQPYSISVQDQSSTKGSPATGVSGLLNVVHGVDSMEAVEIPGKTSIALSYPDHRVSITDKTTNEMMYFKALSNATVSAIQAHALYTSLKPVTTELSLVIKNRGFNCVPLKSTKLDLNLYVIDNIVFGKGDICGLEHMQPGSNVTITKDDDNFMEVTLPLIFKDLTVKIRSVDVNNYFFAVVKGQPIEASVKEISCMGRFSFKKGTSFELSSIHIEWGDITGIHIKLEGALEEGGAVSGMVDSIAEALSGVIKSFISPILDEIEKQINRNIVGR